MVAYVLSALQEAETIDRVLLVAPGSFPPQPEADELVPADGDLPDNIRKGIERCGAAPFVLIITADLPFLTAAGVDDYVRSSLALDVDCAYSVLTEEVCSGAFPEMKRTYLRSNCGRVTGGNAVVQRISTFDRQAELLREAYRRRKSPLFLARMIGVRNVVKFLFGQLSLQDIEKAASRLMGVRCVLLPTPHAGLGTDVDRPEDILLARRLLQSP
jgi:2-phospho-L-lactate guanylyltransferase (CobY/MobA/RfbA family)